MVVGGLSAHHQMTPETLSKLLGPGHNVPYDRLAMICHAFNRELKRAMTSHVLEYHHGYLRLETDKDGWRRSMPAN